MDNNAYISTCKENSLGCWHEPCPTVSHTTEPLAHPLAVLACMQTVHQSLHENIRHAKDHSQKRCEWISTSFVSFHPTLSCTVFPVGFARSWVLIHPYVTLHGISTSPHFQALKPLVCDMGFVSHDSEQSPHKITDLFTVECGRTMSSGLGAGEWSLILFYLIMQDIPSASADFGGGGGGRNGLVSSSWKAIFEHGEAFLFLL